MNNCPPIKKVNASFQILLIANSDSISGFSFLLLSSWFGTVFKLSKRRPSALKQASI